MESSDGTTFKTSDYRKAARFGERLKVKIDFAPEIGSENIPSLILQPIVENALKHGLGPKPEPGHLRISAVARENNLCLTVEDDGIGLCRSALTKNANGPISTRTELQGVGLANVAKRLKTVYLDRAAIKLEPREAGGSRVTILIPRGSEVTDNEEHHR